jgi:hypothetical protein
VAAGLGIGINHGASLVGVKLAVAFVVFEFLITLPVI